MIAIPPAATPTPIPALLPLLSLDGGVGVAVGVDAGVVGREDVGVAAWVAREERVVAVMMESIAVLSALLLGLV